MSMKRLAHLEDFTSKATPLVLTIGNFDGVHRGHQAVLNHVKLLTGSEGESVVLTFLNHPSGVLNPNKPVPLLCHISHRLNLIEKIGISTSICIPFTLELAKKSAAAFIQQLRQSIPFTHLVLGFDATIGCDKQGDQMVMSKLSRENNFQIFYQKEFCFNKQPVSSTEIRTALKLGNLHQVESLMNRPYSIFSTVISGLGKGKLLGFATANLDVSGLCLPPYGVYAVDVIIKAKKISGIANLGIAPTIRYSLSPRLEVHLLDAFESECYGENIEVIFLKFIRPEKKFSDFNELASQIALDIQGLNNDNTHPSLSIKQRVCKK